MMSIAVPFSVIAALSLSQIIGWGTTFYMPAVLASPLAGAHCARFGSKLGLIATDRYWLGRGLCATQEPVSHEARAVAQRR
jgi:hypothetical protein